MKWRDVNDFPDKSGMYITEVYIIEDGLVYRPVAYNHFDKILARWTNVRCCAEDGAVTKWLDESQASDKDKEIDLLEAREIAWSNKVKFLEDEIELRDKLIEKMYWKMFQHHLTVPDNWQLFKKENNL